MPAHRRPIALSLILLVLLAYEGVRRCGFVGYDDPLYVSANPHVLQGLTAGGVQWAFSAGLLFDTPGADYWAPLTVLSRMLDATLFGLDPVGHHLTNVILHALNASVLFLVLDTLTGAFGRSALVAALFAVHPLCVESVAWVTERKDVLSGLLWLLGIGAYARYARSPSRGRYWAVAGVLVLGLMAKPIAMTLPVVLLLLDYWPLRRVHAGGTGLRSSAPALLAEKIPLLLLAALSLSLTFFTMRRSGHLRELASLPPGARIANAVYSYVVYLGKALWPHPLAVSYPYPRGGLPMGRVLAALVILTGLSMLALRQRRRRPYVLAGWLWFLAVLFPVIGLVQSGVAARADRYMYLPLVGLALVAAWGVGDLVENRRRAKLLLSAIGVGVLLTLTVLTRRQVHVWSDTTTLFEHALRFTSDNFLAQNNLATALAQRGELDAAEAHYREALRIRADYAEARRNLGTLLVRRGRADEAAALFAQALERNPADIDAHLELGTLCAGSGRNAEAARHYAAVLHIDPRSSTAHYRWGNLLARSGQWAAAEEHYAQAVRLRPTDTEALNNLGLSQALQGKWREAIESYTSALQIDPFFARARTNLGRALAGQGRHAEAISQCWAALRISSGDVDAHFYLGQSMAARGWLDPAIVQMETVLVLDPAYPGAEAALSALRRATGAGVRPRPSR
jgi:tetratricopeptide (TPR) repeat protein